MAFRDSFHEVVPGYRINGDAVVFVVRSVKRGGIGDGQKILEIGNFGVGHRFLIEVPEGEVENWPVPDSYLPVTGIDAIYEALQKNGLSSVISNVLVNPANVALLEYDDNQLTAQSVGGESRFVFKRSSSSVLEQENGEYFVPTAEFDEFKTRALAALSTVLEILGESASSYINFDGSNDYVEFSGTSAGLLDWDADWTIGVQLVDYKIVTTDGDFITLFSSGQNAIMLRHGGSYGLYVTGNDGQTKVGINTWHAPDPGGKLLFTYSGTTDKRLRYYIGSLDGSYALRGTYTVNTANIGGNNVGTTFCIGKRVTSNNVATSLNYDGGLNNFIYADEVFAGPLVEGYFGVNNTYDESEFYGDLVSWVPMGEDTYPAVVDKLGALTGGALYDGTEDDFVELPSAE